MEALLVSSGVVALAEVGDKTQLLALLLAARYRKPLPITLGILVATVFNHAFAGAVGAWLTHLVDRDVLRWVLAASFLAMAAWMLVPDELDDTEPRWSRFGVFGTTVITFFFAEMGDKTQIATIAMAARFDTFSAVVAGTTLGMMFANVPAVLLGDRLATRIPVKLVHGIAAAVFALLGVGLLAGWGASALESPAAASPPAVPMQPAPPAEPPNRGR